MPKVIVEDPEIVRHRRTRRQGKLGGGNEAVPAQHVLRIWMEGQQVRYGAPSVWRNGVGLRVPPESEYIRSVGRHALRRAYHTEDFHKLMTGTRRVSALVPLKSLRAQDPPGHV